MKSARTNKALLKPLSTPVEIQLQPTNHCNANCQFCWLHNRKRDFTDLPDEWWLALADELCSLDIPRICFCGGGEPLVRSELILQMMEKFSQAGIEGTLITNGMLITDYVAKKIVELRWKSIQVSIHASNKEINDIIMGKKGAFDIAIKGIMSLNRYKDFYKSSMPEIDLRMVCTETNAPTLPDFVELAHSLGISRVYIKRDNREGLVISPREQESMKEYLARATAIAKELGQQLELEFEYDDPLEDTSYHAPPQEISSNQEDQSCISEELPSQSEESGEVRPHCYIPFTELVIFANGTASPCCNYFGLLFRDQEESAGWLEPVEVGSLIKKWQQGFSSLRESMLPNGHLSPTCARCSIDMSHRMEQEPDFSFERKLEHLRKTRQYDTGIQFVRDHLVAHPRSTTLYRYLAEFSMEKQDYATAIKTLERLKKITNDAPRVWPDLGRCHFEMEEYEKAIDTLQEGLCHLESKESRLQAYALLARCQCRIEKYGHMKNHLRKATKIVEDLTREGVNNEETRSFIAKWPALFLYNEFTHFRKRDQYRKGIQFGEYLLDEFAESPILHHHLGEFHMELGEYGKAIEHLSKAVQLDQKMEWTHFSLGKCFYLTGGYKEAEKAFRDNLRLTTERLSHFHSWLFLAMGADARKDRSGCQKALQSLKDFKEFLGNEIPLEREFLIQLKDEERLPVWLEGSVKKEESI